MNLICKRYLISGNVQGVCYRGSAQSQANELGLQGWVRNLSDGRVEMYVMGKVEAVNSIEKWLEIGPEYAKVTNIEVIYENINEDTETLAEHFQVLSTIS